MNLNGKVIDKVKYYGHNKKMIDILDEKIKSQEN